MKKSSLTIALLVASSSLFSQAILANSDSGFTGNVSGIMGNASRDGDGWEDADNQAMFGVIGDFKMQHWPVSIAIDGMLHAADKKAKKSNGKNQTLYTGVNTLQVGVRKIWQSGYPSIHPYIGAGISLTQGYKEVLINDKKDDEQDDDIGSWVGTGVYWRPSKHWNVGFDMRYSKADIKLADQDVDAGGMQYGVSMGYHW